MTRLDIQGAGGASELPGKGSLASKRIDAAHVPYGSSDDSTGDPSDTGRNSMENDSAQVIAQLQYHASQLGTHLQSQRKALDRRESQLNSQAAFLENELRTTRLMLAEREKELLENEADLERKYRQRELEIVERKGELDRQARRREQQTRDQEAEFQQQLTRQESEVEQQLGQQRLELQEREEEFERSKIHQEKLGKQREAELDRRQASLKADADRHVQEIKARHEELQNKAREIEQRELQLTTSSLSLHSKEENVGEEDRDNLSVETDNRIRQLESELKVALERSQQQEQELDSLHKQFSENQDSAPADAVDDPVDSTTQHQCKEEESVVNNAPEAPADLMKRRRWLEAEFARRKQILDERNETLAKRQTALEQLHTDVSRLHRETLEMRLVTEELWLKISEKTSPAVMTRSLAQLRSKLSDHYRLANSRLAQQKQDVEQLSLKLNGKYQALHHQRTNLQRWLERRNEEIEEQAARLVARELELDRQQTQLVEGREQWEMERERHQTEMKRVMQKLREVEAASV